MWSTQNDFFFIRNQSQRSRDHIKEKVLPISIVTTKTEQNNALNGKTMFNTSNEGTGGLGISYSPRNIRGKVLNFILLNVRIDWKAKYARKPLFSEFYGIVLAMFNPCILCHRKLSYLMIKSVDLKFFQDQSSGCRCSIAFFF